LGLRLTEITLAFNNNYIKRLNLQLEYGLTGSNNQLVLNRKEVLVLRLHKLVNVIELQRHASDVASILVYQPVLYLVCRELE
jgi:hypothetical protein